MPSVPGRLSARLTAPAPDARSPLAVQALVQRRRDRERIAHDIPESARATAATVTAAAGHPENLAEAYEHNPVVRTVRRPHRRRSIATELEATRWTGHPGYPIYSMIGMALAKSIYAVPTWTRTVALVKEQHARRAAIAGSTPSRPSTPAIASPPSFACTATGARRAAWRPISPLRQTIGVARGDNKAPTCEHGECRVRPGRLWPQGDQVALPHRRSARLASHSVKADRLRPLIPRETPRFRSFTVVALPSSASSDGSRTSGRWDCLVVVIFPDGG